MALGIMNDNGGTGDIIPIIKYDAKAGDFIRVDREQTASGEWVKNQSELQLPTKVIMDFANVETGWLSFDSGAPNFHMVKLGQPMPPKPSDQHKMAFRVRLYNKDLGLREMSSQAKTVIREMDALHNEFEAQAGSNPGKVPVVTIAGTKAVTVNTPQGESRFKVPDWSITEWVDRPEGMDAGAAVAPTPAPAPAPATDEGDFF